MNLRGWTAFDPIFSYDRFLAIKQGDKAFYRPVITVERSDVTEYRGEVESLWSRYLAEIDLDALFPYKDIDIFIGLKEDPHHFVKR